jgi:2-oxoglutarate dehydrogenase E1 component
MRKKFEEGSTTFDHTPEKRKRILQKLNEAVVFENFLQTKYVGQKRFSLEGGENTIPALDSIINRFAELGGKEVVIGMAHRGRLNILANILGKTYEYIFSEFEGEESTDELSGSGDVKYHKGYTAITEATNGEKLYLKIMANPSHLETVGSVVQGYIRAQGDLVYYGDMSNIIPVVIHGDAAVAGQGIVYESLQMSKLKAYGVGGTIHFVINNQIGFTTDFTDSRSSDYCTSVGKSVDCPIIHVNGDDGDAVVYACELAVEFRQKFKQDVFIDMVCYRKYGHNEGDEPKFTQPHLYGLIAKAENPREIYFKKLLKFGKIEEELAKNMELEFKKLLSDRFNNIKQDEIPVPKQGPHKEWLNLRWSKAEDFEKSPESAVSNETLENVLKAVTSVPEDFKLLKKAERILKDREKKFKNNVIDWALAENFAYGTLLTEGKQIRFTGQDVIRGTFSHRHAKVFDEYTNNAYCGLENIQEEQGQIQIFNSLLSEYAVLAFEYGYSQGTPHGLTIWEAQFGDFSNGAQIVIDQFISAAEQKWRRMTGLVLLLPHGHEGSGPEHSSARLERYLQLAAEFNMVVAIATTPANFFHLLRRQIKWEFRKPLIHFSPKSLLRHPQCVSPVKDFTEGGFKEFIDDDSGQVSHARKVLFCSGKVYYDLKQRKEKEEHNDVAIVRMEQLYPIAKNQLGDLLKKYDVAKKVWVQEEPHNMGAYFYLKRFEEFKDFEYVGRPESAAPATGHASVHVKEQKEIVDKAFS